MKILFAGETWVKHIIHQKGFDTFTNSEFGNDSGWFIGAMEEGNIEVVHLPSHETVDKFPTTLEELQTYDAVILSDVGSNSLLLSTNTFTHGVVQPNRLELIKEYVKKGGSFAMIGGYMSFQGIDCKGRYKDTPIEEILPVDLYDFDDRSEHPEGITIDIVKPDHPILEGIPSEWPHFLGYNKLKAKSDAIVLAKHQENPFISVMEYGKGRTLAFASDCAPHWGPKEFIEWEYYNKFWINAVNWLTKNNR